MADPVFVDCPADAWTKVATAVVSGTVHQINRSPKYQQTYRTTGGAAPTLITDGAVAAFCSCDAEQISASADIDIYLWPIGATGRVRVDAS